MSQFWKNKKVLVTGHEGFLGSWLTKRLVDSGAKVVAVDKVTNRKKSILDGYRKRIKAIKGDIANAKVIRALINKTKPQYIFHLAAEAIVGETLKNPITAFKSNIEGTWNILEAARGKKYLSGMVVASSDKAYGTHKILPYTENFALQGNHPYDASKSCTDLLCQTYSHTYKTPVCITRCGNIYGPGDFHFSRIVPDGVCSAIKNKQLVIRSNGKFTRDYIYVEDIVDAYLLLAQKMKSLKLSGQAFNFSTENPMSVLQLFREINKAVGQKQIKPKVLNQGKFEIPHQYLSAKKARRILKWRPKHTLKQGLTKTIQWYRDNG